MVLVVDNDMIESLWVRKKGKANEKVIVGVCNQPPSQDNNIDELFYKELRDVSRSTALVLTSDFNFPGINWEYCICDTNRSRKFLKHI